MAAKTTSKTLVWGLLALLILGLGGFGVTNLSGTIRSVGSVGDKDISVDSYAQALQQDLRAIEAQTGQSLSLEEADRFGLTQGTLDRLIAGRALDNETERLGISIGDETLGEQLRAIPAFQGIDGNFDREGYTFALDRAGLKESTFEARLREETARTILQAAIVSGDAMPQVYADTLLNFMGERRKVTWARLDQTDLDEPLPEPSEEELLDWYNKNVDRFTSPEKKRITYAWLAPDMVIDMGNIDAQLLRDRYEERIDEFDRPERRLVERLVFSDEASAEEARRRLDADEVDFDTLVEERGLAPLDIDLGDVTQDQLGQAGDGVFAAESGDVVGPLPSNLGPALFRVNGILAAESVSFEDASLILRDEIASDRARRAVEAQMEPTEDLLAGGATLEELAQETDMQLDTIDWFEGLGEGIAAYEGFDAVAEALTADDYPEVRMLDDGTIYAMRLDEVIEPAPMAFEDVRDRVRAGWDTEQTLQRLTVKAENMQARLAESADFAGLGLEPKVEESLSRNGSVLGAPQSFVRRAFEMSEGEVAITQGFGAVQILRLDAVLPPSKEDPGTQQLADALREQASQSVAQDLYNAYAAELRDRAGVRIDRNALNAVHSNFR